MCLVDMFPVNSVCSDEFFQSLYAKMLFKIYISLQIKCSKIESKNEIKMYIIPKQHNFLFC
jgi:hypothetical protein